MDSLEKEKTTISLKEMWDLFYFNRFRITLITATVSILSIIYALILTPVFKAELLMIPTEAAEDGALSQVSRLGGLASLAGINLGSGSNASTETYVAILQSRSFQTSFLKDNQYLEKILIDDWDQKNSNWKSDIPPTLMDGYRQLKTIFFVGVDNNTSLISLSFYSEDPAFASEFLNKIIE